MEPDGSAGARGAADGVVDGMTPGPAEPGGAQHKPALGNSAYAAREYSEAVRYHMRLEEPEYYWHRRLSDPVFGLREAQRDRNRAFVEAFWTLHFWQCHQQSLDRWPRCAHYVRGCPISLEAERLGIA